MVSDTNHNKNFNRVCSSYFKRNKGKIKNHNRVKKKKYNICNKIKYS